METEGIKPAQHSLSPPQSSAAEQGWLLPPLQDMEHSGGAEETTLNITSFTEFNLVKLLLRSECLSVSQ